MGCCVRHLRRMPAATQGLHVHVMLLTLPAVSVSNNKLTNLTRVACYVRRSVTCDVWRVMLESLPHLTTPSQGFWW